jgi:lipopolysaccharide export system permease protein
MLIVPRYILRAHIAPFLFGTSVVMFLFLMQFILKYIDELIGKGLGTWVILQLIALNLSWMVVLAVPMGVLFSTLMVFGSLSASHEITVLKASGAGLVRLMLPVIAVGIIATGGMFWFNDAILPDTNHKAKIMLWDIKKKKPTFDIEAGQFSTQLEGYTILSRSLDSARGLLLGVTIYDRTAPERTNVVSADTGSILFSRDDRNVVVLLRHGEIHQLFTNQASVFRHIRFDAHRIIIPASGFTLQQSTEGVFARGDREMHISDMQVVVDEARRQQDIARKSLDTMLTQHVEFLFGDAPSSSMVEWGVQREDAALGRLDVLRSHRVARSADGRRRPSGTSVPRGDLQEIRLALRLPRLRVRRMSARHHDPRRELRYQRRHIPRVLCRLLGVPYRRRETGRPADRLAARHVAGQCGHRRGRRPAHFARPLRHATHPFLQSFP